LRGALAPQAPRQRMTSPFFEVLVPGADPPG
jgi:hypothetical protein